MNAKTLRDLMQAATRLHQAGRLDQAKQIYQQVLGGRPGHADAIHLLGVIACQRGQFDRGFELISQAILLLPHRGDFYSSLGNAISGLKRMEEAIIAYRRAFELDPKNLGAINNLAMALDHQDRTPEALDCFDRLLAANADVAQWHTNRGSVLFNAGQLPAAIASQRRAISLQPDLAGAHIKLATALLSSGEFAEGWREFAWRFKAGVIADPTYSSPAPVWDGSPIPGKTLLIQSEQGLGDFFQCVRYAPLLAAQGVEVMLRCPAGLRKLMERVVGVKQVITADEPIPPHEFQVPIFSLPLLFHTAEQTIPQNIPYIHADRGKADKYVATDSGKRVGLVWAGFEGHGNNRRRSCPPELLNVLANVDGIDFYRLQMPRNLPGPSDLKLIDHTADFQDFDDTAALISKLDLVISVDTSVAHLAGAMGKPIWVLLPFAAEWRWLTQREDSPWYPTARLFRQTSTGDWVGVMQRVRTALQAMAVQA